MRRKPCMARARRACITVIDRRRGRSPRLMLVGRLGAIILFVFGAGALLSLFMLPSAATSTAAPERFLPCTVGLSIEYVDVPKSDPSSKDAIRMTETIRGPGKE